jgi:hypothetical protein
MNIEHCITQKSTQLSHFQSDLFIVLVLEDSSIRSFCYLLFVDVSLQLESTKLIQSKSKSNPISSNLRRVGENYFPA